MASALGTTKTCKHCGQTITLVNEWGDDEWVHADGSVLCDDESNSVAEPTR